MSEKLSKEKLAQAKDMYLNFRSVPEISMETGLNPRSIRYHVDNYWAKERRTQQEKFFEFIADNKKVQLINITDRALTLIENALTEMSSKPHIKMQDARMAADILEKIDRILKLDEGKATSITTSAPPSTVFELKKRLKVDPFIQLDPDHEEIVTPGDNSPSPESPAILNPGKQ
jgi:hypothetical protein